MSQFNYLTGRPELFENAPADAMVVLEHDDGRLFYAIAHELGARYWNEDGTAGSNVGLIALHKKTRVIASRVRADGLPPVAPKRDPIPKSRLDRMQEAQNSLKKAVSQPAPVAPKPEPKPAPVKLETPVITPRVEPVKPKPEPAKPAAPAAPKVDGFVSIFAMGTKRGTGSGTFLTLYRNGNIGLSAKVPLVTGDVVDVQVDFARGLIRVGKVSAGGRALPKSRTLTNKALVDTFKMPEGRSLRIYLAEADGWWQGQAELAGVKP